MHRLSLHTSIPPESAAGPVHNQPALLKDPVVLLFWRAVDSVSYFLSGAPIVYTATFTNDDNTAAAVFSSLVVTADGTGVTGSLTCDAGVNTTVFEVPASSSVACSFTVAVSSSDITTGSLAALTVAASSSDTPALAVSVSVARSAIKLYAPAVDVAFSQTGCTVPTSPGAKHACLRSSVARLQHT